MHAFDACRVGRYPTPNSPGKLDAYRQSLRMFRKAAKFFAPPLEIVSLPFDGNKLIGYLQRPPGAAKPPVVLHWGGVDGWKEDRLRIAKTADGRRPRLAHHRHAWHRGESGAVRRSRRGTHVLCLARSFVWTAGCRRHARRRLGRQFRRLLGGAARLCARPISLKAAVFHGGNVHYGFQKEWLVPRRSPPAARPICSARKACSKRAAAPWAPKHCEEFIDIAAAGFSLLTMGLIDKPSAPILGCQRQARRPGSGRRHLFVDGARLAEIGAHLPQRPPHGPHARLYCPSTSR